MSGAMGQVETLQGGFLPLRRLRVLAVRHLWLGLIVFTASLISLRLGSISFGLAAVWIGNGLYIGFALCVNPRRRNELLVIAGLVNYVANRLASLSPAWSLCLTATDLTQIFVATYPLRRLPVLAIDLTRFRVLLKVALSVTLLGCAAAVVLLALWTHYIMKIPMDFTFFLSWFCSDAVGAAVTVPLYWFYRRKPKRERVPAFRYQAHITSFLFGAVVAMVFWQAHYPILFLLFPVLLPVIYVNGFKGAAWAVLFTTVAGVLATAYGHGPLMLMHTSPETRILFLQFYLAVALITAFPFAALLMEREKLVLSLRTSEARYRDLARLDGLTQLPNRREFDSFLDISRQRAVRQNTPLSLLLIDIDHFKKLNDLHGHTTGDDYLRRMAVAVASAVPRKTDLVARYGGEEFAVVLDSCDDAGAIMVAERIKTTVAALSQKLVAGKKPAVSVSIGVATTYPELRTPSKVLIDAADQGLYAAKRNGRDRIERGTDLRAQAVV